jgi:hypothetical protein
MKISNMKIELVEVSFKYTLKLTVEEISTLKQNKKDLKKIVNDYRIITNKKGGKLIAYSDMLHVTFYNKLIDIINS